MTAKKQRIALTSCSHFHSLKMISNVANGSHYLKTNKRKEHEWTKQYWGRNPKPGRNGVKARISSDDTIADAKDLYTSSYVGSTKRRPVASHRAPTKHGGRPCQPRWSEGSPQCGDELWKGMSHARALSNSNRNRVHWYQLILYQNMCSLPCVHFGSEERQRRLLATETKFGLEQIGSLPVFIAQDGT